MSRGIRFFVIFAIQFVLAYIFITAMNNGNSDMVTFAAGAVVMTEVLMIIIFVMASISINDKK